MPITVAASSSLDQKISVEAKNVVERTVFSAQQYVGHALESLGKGLSVLEQSIWQRCFLSEPDDVSIRTASNILQKTYNGICQPHTVKLADSNYVRSKYGAFGGEKGSIHLNSTFFKDSSYSADMRIWIYIHEATHKFADTKDIGDSCFGASSEIAYLEQARAIKNWDFKYRKEGVTARAALNNADSFAAFVVGVWQCRSAA